MLGAGGSKSPYLVEGAVPGEMLDIPAWARDWADYSASSGHLINHAAAPGVEYRDCRHPRFGHVLCVLTVRDIARGEELFVKVKSQCSFTALKWI